MGATDALTVPLIAAIRAAANELGYRSQIVESAADETSVDALLAVGPPHYYDSLLATAPATRRIAWFGEPLPAPDAAAVRWSFRVREQIIDRALRATPPVRWLRSLPLPAPVAAVRAAAYVEHERQVNMAAAVRSSQAVTLVVTTSRDRGRALGARGIAARVVPFGYHPDFAGALTPAATSRDLDVVMLGSGLGWARRRSTAVRRLVARLGGRWTMAIRSEVWGPERDALLRDSRAVLDVHRIPGNFIGIRLLLALAAGAVLVTEPMDDPYPFVPGEHFVAAPLARLPDELEAILRDEPRRRRMVEAGQALISGPLTMASSLRAVLA